MARLLATQKKKTADEEPQKHEQKRARRDKTAEQLNILNGHFEANPANPGGDTLLQLVAKTSLSEKEIKVWFQKRAQRANQQAKKAERGTGQGGASGPPELLTWTAAPTDRAHTEPSAEKLDAAVAVAKASFGTGDGLLSTHRKTVEELTDRADQQSTEDISSMKRKCDDLRDAYGVTTTLLCAVHDWSLFQSDRVARRDGGRSSVGNALGPMQDEGDIAKQGNSSSASSILPTMNPRALMKSQCLCRELRRPDDVRRGALIEESRCIVAEVSSHGIETMLHTLGDSQRNRFVQGWPKASQATQLQPYEEKKRA